MTYRLMNKLVVAIVAGACGLLLASSTALAAAGAYPYIYRSPRIMAMGGANVAVGGGFDSVFYNPAGIGTMKKGNWEVDLLGVQADVDTNVQDFYDDLSDAFDVGDLDGDGDDQDDQLTRVNEVLKDYRGSFMHASVQDVISLSRKSGPLAVGAGGIWGGKMDAITHQGFGSDGLLEVDAYGQAGGVGAMSYEFAERLNLGASVKALSRESVQHIFTARELVEHEDDIEDYIMDDVRESGTAYGVDVGAIYSFYRESWFRPSLGVSVLDIGDLDFGDAGEIPTTVNLGVALRPDIPQISGCTIGLDYVDILNEYEQDDDVGKRLRLGGELLLYSGSWSDIGISAGLYQGYATFGLNLRLAIVQLMYATYAEEVGYYAGQNEDRRHMLMVNLEW